MKVKSIFSRALLCASLLLLPGTTLNAQMSEKEKQEKELAGKQQIERKAYLLVEETANEAPGLKLPDNRSFVLSAAADLLWEHNEPRARSLFWDALNTIGLLTPPASNDPKDPITKPTAKDREQKQSEYFMVFALRQELLGRVARRDPQLALDMLRSSRQPQLEMPERGFPLPDDRELEQQIAAEAAARDPQTALHLARESLAKGLSFQLFGLLYRLNQKDTKLGTTFAGDIIVKLRSMDLAHDPVGGRIAASLITTSRSPAVTQERIPSSAQWGRLKLNKEQRRELVEMVANAALSGPSNGSLLFDIDEIMPELQEFTPERVAMLQRKILGFNQRLTSEQKISQEYNSLFQNGTPEDMLKLANRAPEGDRFWMQQQAVVLAVMRRRADALREYVNAEIKDESHKKRLLDQLDSEQIDFAVNSGSAEELRKLLPTLRLKEQRARAMVEIALVMEKKGGHDEALKLLDEAHTMIKTDLSSETQTNALLALMAAYALVEPAKAFGIIERVIDRANEDIAKLLLLDKIIKSGAVKKGEIKLQNSGVIPLDFAAFRYGKGVAALATADFERTKAAADRFQRNELRIMGRLLLAQALLREDKKLEVTDK